MRHKDGHWVWVHDRGKVTPVNSYGLPLSMAGAHEDITDRKNAEEAERKASARRQREAEVVAAIATSPALAESNLQSLAVTLTEAAAGAIGVERIGIWLFENGGTRLVNIDLFTASTHAHAAGSPMNRIAFLNEFGTIADTQYIDADNALTDPRTAGSAESYLRPNNISSMLDRR